MTDDHAHGPDCGHNHNLTPNPYTDTVHENAYREFVMQMFRIGCLTVRMDVPMTIGYVGMACVGMAPPVRHDAISTFRALLWELARLASDLAGGKPLQFQFAPTDGCNDPSHDHPPAVDGELDAETQFGADLLKAFFSAAADGDLEAAVQVGNASAREADTNERQPEGYVVGLFANSLASLAYTAVVSNPFPPAFLFEP